MVIGYPPITARLISRSFFLLRFWSDIHDASTMVWKFLYDSRCRRLRCGVLRMCGGPRVWRFPVIVHFSAYWDQGSRLEGSHACME